MSERGCERATCPIGGPAPCVDDLCHGVDVTVCGLEVGFDFCGQGLHTEECPTRLNDDDDE